ncbi:RodZ family helix-turn-helix domain-containing protein [Mycobacteroides abscessus]|uniref:hypothetical protein n=1 Tax=Mycobacteroides abscessus TaxID=36809 RepID=UPI001F1824DE|nr:hypothetical protein [Mycobacteroides abscessus]
MYVVSLSTDVGDVMPGDVPDAVAGWLPRRVRVKNNHYTALFLLSGLLGDTATDLQPTTRKPQIPFFPVPLNTLGMAKGAQGSSTEKDEAEGWRRLGAMLAEARKDLGYSSREDFAAVAGVSTRVLTDLEGAVRTNFSARIISSVESGVGWPAGTIDQIISDPDFVPPSPAAVSGELVYRPPNFNRQPVEVEVGAVERNISLLTEISRDLEKDKKPATVLNALQRLSAQVISLSWPYIIRLVEDNCLPGHELHPAVRPIYEVFLARQAEFAPNETSGLYAQWLAGDSPDVPETVRRRYMERWNESR